MNWLTRYRYASTAEPRKSCCRSLPQLIWLLFRWRGIRWFGPGGLKAAANLVLIMAFWGVFQLFLTGLMFLWDAGGLTPFHPDDAPAVSAPADPTAFADPPKPAALPDSSAPVEPAP